MAFKIEPNIDGIVEFDMDRIVAEGCYEGGKKYGKTRTVRAQFDKRDKSKLVSIYGVLKWNTYENYKN